MFRIARRIQFGGNVAGGRTLAIVVDFYFDDLAIW
jgi:hypothetical protein